ncbi:hypothetical protein KM043_007426 [Ampulex compressa]|nr:hypothetical protein KM043_007426 [Ampulex compressa]
MGKKDAKKEKTTQNVEKSEEDTKKSSAKSIKSKYGPIVTFPYQRIWSRCVLILGVIFIVWYNIENKKEVYLAKQEDVLVTRTQNVECSEDYIADVNKYPGCVPEKCARVVTDKLVTSAETNLLLRLAMRGLKLGGSDGGASVLDLHSGALSKGSGFIDIYQLPEAEDIVNSVEFKIYKAIKAKIQHAVAHNFGLPVYKIFLTKPTFFSRLTNAPAMTVHDEYWHPHVDKETYESFHYTSLLYLNDFGKDFQGGRFLFLDKNNVTMVVEPKKGRVSMFTSGSENVHAVEEVKSGTRYALMVSFTCDQNMAISDPSIENLQKNTNTNSYK